MCKKPNENILRVTVVPAPPALTSFPRLAILLPPSHVLPSLNKWKERSCEYHCLDVACGYTSKDPFALDADAYVEAVFDYVRTNRLDGVVAQECFSSALASIVTTELGLPGPSFRSVFVCNNKYLTREEFTPDFGHASLDVLKETAATLPSSMATMDFPCVVKVPDTQNCVGVRVVRNMEQAQDILNYWKQEPQRAQFEKRRRFWFKWATRFGWDIAPCAEELVLSHVERYIPPQKGRRELQAEIVFAADGEVLLSDTGNIDHSSDTGWPTLFKTPGDFEFTPVLRSFLKCVAEKLVKLGFKNGSVDVEFMQIAGETERYELIEINSRYSHMGDFEVAYSADRQTVIRTDEPRNLDNASRLALGKLPRIIPCRDQKGLSRVAFFVCTNRAGPVSNVLNHEAVVSSLRDSKIHHYDFHAPASKGIVTEKDLHFNNGWVKLVTFFFVCVDDVNVVQETINGIIKSVSISSSGDNALLALMREPQYVKTKPDPFTLQIAKQRVIAA